MKNIIFFVRHFTERGTEIAIYDYAKYNEEILGNKSYICCFTPSKQSNLRWPITRVSYEKFNSRFKIFEVNDISDISKIIDSNNIDYFYTLTDGCPDIYQFNNKNIWGNCKTIKHCVFQTRYPESDFYISISSCLNDKNNTKIPVIPHIVSLPETNETLRNELNIPDNAIILGRHGGYDEFNISMTHNAIRYILDKNTNIYFLFMNTREFYKHPRIIYVNCNLDLIYKRKFINTCDAMIHARNMGETFGLAIAEFSYCNKPVITCQCGDLEHIKILGDKAIIYKTYEDLINIFTNINELILSKLDWNAYKDYSPEIIMKLFDKFIFQL